MLFRSIEAAIAEGQYSDPEAAHYILQTVIQRRDIVGRYWFSKVNPLDRFEIRNTSDGQQGLHFVDLAVESGLESANGSEYWYDVIHAGRCVQEISPSKRTYIPLTEFRDKTGTWELRIHTKRNSKWMKPVKVYLHSDSVSGTVALMGVRH